MGGSPDGTDGIGGYYVSFDFVQGEGRGGEGSHSPGTRNFLTDNLCQKIMFLSSGFFWSIW